MAFYREPLPPDLVTELAFELRSNRNQGVGENLTRLIAYGRLEFARMIGVGIGQVDATVSKLCDEPLSGQRDVHQHPELTWTAAIVGDTELCVGTIELTGLEPQYFAGENSKAENPFERLEENMANPEPATDITEFVSFSRICRRPTLKPKYQPVAKLEQGRNGEIFGFSGPHAQPALASGTDRLLYVAYQDSSW